MQVPMGAKTLVYNKAVRNIDFSYFINVTEVINVNVQPHFIGWFSSVNERDHTPDQLMLGLVSCFHSHQFVVYLLITKVHKICIFKERTLFPVEIPAFISPHVFRIPIL